MAAAISNSFSNPGLSAEANQPAVWLMSVNGKLTPTLQFCNLGPV